MSTTGSLVLIDSSHLNWHDVLSLDAAHFPHPWAFQDWEGIDFTRHHLFILVEGATLMGFALFHALPMEETIHLLKICISPEFKGKKVAQMFWHLMVEKIRENGHKSVFLEVEVSNHSALAFYFKVGFLPLRIVKGFYSGGCDAQTMLITL